MKSPESKKKKVSLCAFLFERQPKQRVWIGFSTWIDCACMLKETIRRCKSPGYAAIFLCWDEKVYKNFTSLRTQPQHPEYEAGATGVNGGVTCRASPFHGQPVKASLQFTWWWYKVSLLFVETPGRKCGRDLGVDGPPLLSDE